MPPTEAERANLQMVDRIIAQGSLWTKPLIAAFRATPRHCFVDRVFQFQRKPGRWKEIVTRDPDAEALSFVYSDRALITAIRSDDTIELAVGVSSSSQPSLMAQMLEDLRPRAGQRILEIGAGTGYNAALMAHVAGPNNVTSVDVDRSVLSEAWDHLRSFPERRIRLLHADGRVELAGEAPFDRIMVTAATPRVEPVWLRQLTEGGRLVAPWAIAPGLEMVIGAIRTGDRVVGALTRPAYFMPLRAESESGRSIPSIAPHAAHLEQFDAPWAAWLERRSRNSWHVFGQSLAFHGLVHGLDVFCDATEENPVIWGLSDRAGAVCWYLPNHWKANGDAGVQLGERLWRMFLDAGAPWPMDYTFHMDVDGANPVRWELPEERERPYVP